MNRIREEWEGESPRCQDSGKLLHLFLCQKGMMRGNRVGKSGQSWRHGIGAPRERESDLSLLLPSNLLPMAPIGQIQLEVIREPR